MFKNFKNAFSMVETIIIVTVVAVAIAAATPMITKKLVNIGDVGTSLSGGLHGRYEIFTKEIITFDGASYEKTTNTSGPNVGGNSFVAFRKLDDIEFVALRGANPTVNGNKKEALYEQIDNPKVYQNENGEVTYVEFKDQRDGLVKKFPIGNNVTIESSDVIYIKGEIKTVDGVKTFERNSSGSVQLPNNNNRIIDGNLVENAGNYHGNKLWLLKNQNGTVTTIPWERLIEGNKIIKDGPIANTDPKGNPIGEFDPQGKIKNLTIHAVGAGGAGGGVPSNPGEAISPKNATPAELQIMKEELARRFNEVTGANYATDDVVKVINIPNFHKKKYDDPEGVEDAAKYGNKAYIFLNQADGTITVKIDVRMDALTGTVTNTSSNSFTGLSTNSVKKYQVFPHQLLDYTKILGSQTQESLIYDMPVWGSYDDIDFKIGAVGCGTKGGDAADYAIDSTGKRGLSWKEEAFCSGASWSIMTGPCCVHKPIEGEDCPYYEYYWCPYEGANGGGHGCTWRTASNFCSWGEVTCNVGHFSQYKNASNSCSWHSEEGGQKSDCQSIIDSCGCGVTNDNLDSSPCFHRMMGGKGGSKPQCTVVCQDINGPVGIIRDCYNGDPSSTKGTVGGSLSYNFNVLDDLKIATVKSGIPTGFASDHGSTITETRDPFVHNDKHTSTDHDKSFVLTNGSFASLTNGQHGMSCFIYTSSGDSNYQPAGNSIGGVGGLPCGSAQGSLDDKYAIVNFKSSIGADMAKKTPNCQSYTCGINGANGTQWTDGTFSGCASQPGINPNGNGFYNHIYTWTIPYSINRLVYGEAGQVGEYKTTKIPEVTGKLTFTLGKGGVWNNIDNNNTSWIKDQQGPSGTDTTVQMDGKTILTVKGGKGGNPSQTTKRYDLCYSFKGICEMRDNAGNILNSTPCCDNENSMRSTKEIISSNSKASAFDNIKSLVGNSAIVGIGLGRSGEGIGTRAGLEETRGLRDFVNSSGYNINYPQSSIFYPNQNSLMNTASAASGAYKNKITPPSQMSLKGGDGAVIVTW